MNEHRSLIYEVSGHCPLAITVILLTLRHGSARVVCGVTIAPSETTVQFPWTLEDAMWDLISMIVFTGTQIGRRGYDHVFGFHETKCL